MHHSWNISHTSLPPSPMVSMIIKLCHQFTPTWFHYIPPRQESRRRMYWIFQKPENPSWPPPHQQPSYMCFLCTGLVCVSLLCHWCTKWIPNNYVDNEWSSDSHNTLSVSRIIHLMLTCTITRPGLKLGSLFLISSTCPGGWKNPGKKVSPFSWDRSELLGPRLSLRALLQPSLLYLKQYSLKTDNPFDPSAVIFGLQKQQYDTTNFNTSWLILRELV